MTNFRATLWPPLGVLLVSISMMIGAAHYRHPSQSAAPQAAVFKNVAVVPEPDRAPTRAEWRAEQELKAQSAAAWWAEMSVLVGFVGLFLTAGGIFFVARGLRLNRDLLRETAEANLIAREMGEAQIRAYLSIGKVWLDFEGLCPWINIEISNTGNSPAANLVVSGNCRASEPSPHDARLHISGGVLVGTFMAGSKMTTRVWVGHDVEPPRVPGDPIKAFTVEAVVRVNFRDIFHKTRSSTIRYIGYIEGDYRDRPGIQMLENFDVMDMHDFDDWPDSP